MINPISNATLKNKRVLIRVDLNVPFERGKVSDASRIIATIPTIKFVLKNGGRPILISHFGRPENQSNEDFSLKKIIPELTKLIGVGVEFIESLDYNFIQKSINSIPKNKIVLLENSRLFDGEESNSIALSSIFAKFGDLYCNDAFSVSHRTHASIVGITRLLPSYAGLHLKKEITALNQALLDPQKPLVAIVGGSKVSTKLSLLNNLLPKVDHIIVGGGMANTFLFAQNKEIGSSICEKHLIELAQKIQSNAKKFNCKIHLPVDAICAYSFDNKRDITIHKINSCPREKMILDCGPQTVSNIGKILQTAKTLIWNGPLGAFENPPFNKATEEVAKIAATLTKGKKLLSVAGGGDTVAALKNAKVLSEFTYVSNAGGAFLEWIEGKELPGLKALETWANSNQ